MPGAGPYARCPHGDSQPDSHGAEPASQRNGSPGTGGVQKDPVGTTLIHFSWMPGFGKTLLRVSRVTGRGGSHRLAKQHPWPWRCSGDVAPMQGPFPCLQKLVGARGLRRGAAGQPALLQGMGTPVAPGHVGYSHRVRTAPGVQGSACRVSHVGTNSAGRAASAIRHSGHGAWHAQRHPWAAAPSPGTAAPGVGVAAPSSSSQGDPALAPTASPSPGRRGPRHRTTAQNHGTVWAGLVPPATGRDVSCVVRLLRAPSSPTLNTSWRGASTASLGNLRQCPTTLTAKRFPL